MVDGGRDDFWDMAHDVFFLLLKVFLVILAIEIVCLLAGSDYHIPVLHEYLLEMLGKLGIHIGR